MAFLIPHDALTPRKVAGTVQTGTRIVRAGDLELLVRAQAVLDNAHAQADVIVAGAQAAFEAERQRGYEDGKQEALLEMADKMIETVSRTVDYFASVENEMVDLVMLTVRKIVDDFDDRVKVICAVRNALAVVRNQKQMTLRLHPDEVEAVRERINDILSAYPGVSYLDLLADGRVQRGACILESEIGLVEASLEGQIVALRGAFQRTLGSRI